MEHMRPPLLPRLFSGPNRRNAGRRARLADRLSSVFAIHMEGAALSAPFACHSTGHNNRTKNHKYKNGGQHT